VIILTNLKFVKLSLYLKKGNSLDPQNYRPIVIQNVFAKIHEKLFVKRMVNFLVKYNLVNKDQYAYLKGKSVELAIFNFLSKLYDSIDTSSHNIGIFYDYGKAFDLVEHDILFSKLSHLGINGIPLKFIKSFLLNRDITMLN
jgi:hypothetical protein